MSVILPGLGSNLLGSCSIKNLLEDLPNKGIMLVPELEAQAEILSLGNSKDRRVCSIDSSFSTIEEANGFILLAPERNFDSILNLIPEQDVGLDRGPASNLRF